MFAVNQYDLLFGQGSHFDDCYMPDAVKHTLCYRASTQTFIGNVTIHYSSEHRRRPLWGLGTLLQKFELIHGVAVDEQAGRFR